MQAPLNLNARFDTMEGMKISLTLPETNTVANHGYGVAGFGMVTALQSIGVEVPFQDPAAPVEIGFSQPYLWQWSNPDAYHIGYVPWESTRLPENWLAPMQAVDEIWTTSDWCKKMFEKNGLENVRVYQHGVDASGPEGWARRRRRPTGPTRFLHIGEPAPRKGGQLVYNTFSELFANQPEKATLTIKAHGMNTVRGPNLSNVKLIAADLEQFQLVDLIRRHDVLVYPSWGEGFGLIPLQALVTGMPVICTEIWAPYSHLLLENLRLPARLTPSPWPDMHPGNMYEPDADALRSMMALMADPGEYQNASARAYYNSFLVESEYDWVTLTRNAFSHILEKFDSE